MNSNALSPHIPGRQRTIGLQTVIFAIARGFAAFHGSFSILNVLGSIRYSSFDANHWWIGFPGVPTLLSRGLLIGASLLLIGFAVRPAMRSWRKQITLVSVGILLLMALVNSAVFLFLIRSGAIGTGMPLPLSLFIAVALGMVLWKAWQPPSRSRGRDWLVIGVTVGACALVFPLSQMIFFGKTDYRRQADAAVVFGARAYADGRPSDALADRVRTACQLYLDGTVSKLIFSGGPGDGEIHETESMRRMAVGLGVSNSDILLDPAGLNTEATVLNTMKLFQEHGVNSVLAVSHAFHLPRIKMPFLMARETAAWWVYYFRPLSNPLHGVVYGT